MAPGIVTLITYPAGDTRGRGQEIEIIMAMTQRAYAQYVHIHGNKKIKHKVTKLVTMFERPKAATA